MVHSTHMRTSASILVAAVLATASLTAHAASGEALPVTDSGALLAHARLQLQRELLLYQFTQRDDLVRVDPLAEEVRRVEVLWRKRKADARSRCNAELQTVSTARRFALLSRCMRDDLALDASYYARLTEVVTGDLSLSEKLRVRLEDRIDELTEAQTALMDGLDGGIYIDEAELRAAKRKYVELYLRPYWVARSQARADRLMGWIAVLLKQIDSAPAGSPESLLSTDVATMTCLLDASQELGDVVDENDYKKIISMYSQSTTTLGSCLQAMDAPMAEPTTK